MVTSFHWRRWPRWPRWPLGVGASLVTTRSPAFSPSSTCACTRLFRPMRTMRSCGTPLPALAAASETTRTTWRPSLPSSPSAALGIKFVDAGVSGGVWGLENGYCLMVGGDDDAVAQVEPIFLDLAPTDGYAHVGAAGAGHFTKMVHNGIEYGLMQAYAEGFEVLKSSEFDLDLHEIAGIWRYGSVVRSWLLELLLRRLREGGRRSSRRSAATSTTPAKAAGRSPRRSTRTCPSR